VRRKANRNDNFLYRDGTDDAASVSTAPVRSIWFAFMVWDKIAAWPRAAWQGLSKFAPLLAAM
jgi:hypothetical protein